MRIHFEDGKPFGNPEPMPNKNDDKFYQTSSHADFKLYKYNQAVKEWVKGWQQSSIAIKEPEWKLHDKVYNIESGQYRGKYLHHFKNTMTLITHVNTEIIADVDLCSHYYEGQEIDRDKFRLVKWYKHIYKKGEKPYLDEWQPVKEPEEKDFVHYEDFELHAFHEAKIEFQADKKKGLIQLEEIKP